MKIQYVIEPKYTETEIHICADALTKQVKDTQAIIAEAVNVTIAGFDEKGVTMLPKDSILRFFSEKQKVYAQTRDGVYATKSRLYELEQAMDETGFVRISNSEIVNVKAIQRLDTKLTGTIRIYLKHDVETYVSRRYVSKIRKVLGV